jgi:hypothetical protein
MVLNGECKRCNRICNVIHFHQNFDNWTSGNNNIDKFIKDTQLSVHEDKEISHVLEWIPYDRLYNINYIAELEIDKMYSANWVDGYIDVWNYENQDWKRKNQNMIVYLKDLNDSDLNDSKNITLEFMYEV